jgi:outer membrane protein TolC
MMSRFSVFFVLTAALAAAPAVSDLPPQLTLSQALNIALANSTNIRQALARLNQASGRYQQSRSALLPQLDILARQSHQTAESPWYRN